MTQTTTTYRPQRPVTFGAVLGQRVANLRERWAVTQRTLAERSDIPASTLSKLENGEIADPGIVLVERVATALGLRIDELTNLDDAVFAHPGLRMQDSHEARHRHFDLAWRLLRRRLIDACDAALGGEGDELLAEMCSSALTERLGEHLSSPSVAVRWIGQRASLRTEKPDKTTSSWCVGDGSPSAEVLGQSGIVSIEETAPSLLADLVFGELGHLAAEIEMNRQGTYRIQNLVWAACEGGEVRKMVGT